MPRHTPGPWRWSQPVETYSEWQLGAEPDTVVMSVYMSHGGGEMPNEADARLIAAAPELFEALEDLVQRADNTEVAGAGYSIDTAWAHALLARIEGEEEEV